MTGHRILGVDPSTTRTGWAVVDEDGGLVAAGAVRSKAKDREERTNEMAWQMGLLATQHRPTFAYCEQQIFRPGMGNSVTTMAINRVAGAIAFAIHAATARRVQVAYLKASEWRKAIGVKGQGKDVALAHLGCLLNERGIPFSEYGDDEKEAYGIALAGLKEVCGG